MALGSTARGSGSHGTTTTSWVITPASYPAAGNLLVLVLALDNSGSSGAAATCTVSDSQGNTWTSRHVTNRDPGAANAGCTLRIFTTSQDVGTLVSANTITATLGTTTVAKAWALWEITAASGYAARYLSTGTGAGGTGNPSVTTGTIAVGDMTIGGIAYEYGQAPATVDTDTTNGSWSSAQSANVGSTTSGMSVSSQYKLQTTTGSAQTFNHTRTNSSDYAAGWISVDEVQTAFTATAADSLSTLSETNAGVKGGGVTNYTQTAGDSLGTLSETNARAVARRRTGADSLGASYSAAVLADSPVVVFAMDEASGNLVDLVDGKTGVPSGSPTYGITGPVTGHTAVRVNTRNTDYWTVADDPDLDLGNYPFSIELWISRTSDTGSWEALLAKGTNAYSVAVYGSGNDSIVAAKCGVALFAAGTTAISTDGAWHHVVVVRPDAVAANQLVYIDGSPTLSVQSAQTLSDTATALIIGNDPGNDQGMAGGYAYLGIYKSALSSTQVAAHYAAASGAGGGITEGVTKQRSAPRTLGDAISTLTEAVVGVKSGGAALVASVGDAIATLAESVGRAFVGTRSVDDSIGSLGEAAVRLSVKVRTAGDSLATLSEAAVRGVMAKARTAGDSLGTLSEAVVRGVMAKARTGADSIGTLSEVAVRLSVKARTGADSLATLSESAVRAAAAKARTAAETIGTLSEATARAFVGSRAVSDGLATLTEAVVGVKGGAGAFVATAGDVIGSLSESVGRAFVGTRSAGDSLGSLSEAAVRAAMAKARTAGDAVGSLSETAVRAVMAKVRVAGDSLASLTEAVVGVKSGIQSYVASVGDALGSLSESVGRAFVGTRSAAASLATLVEAAVRGVLAKDRTAADAIGTVTESAARVGVFGRTADDVIVVLSDVVVWTTTVISGTTRDEAGDMIPNCVVDCFVAATNAFHATTTSDAFGHYSVTVTPGIEYFLVAYSATGDVYGVTARDLVGV